MAVAAQKEKIERLAYFLYAHAGRTPLVLLKSGTLTSFVVNTDEDAPDSKRLLPQPTSSLPQHSVVVFDPSENTQQVNALLANAALLAVMPVTGSPQPVWVAATSHPMGNQVRAFVALNGGSTFIDTEALPQRKPTKVGG